MSGFDVGMMILDDVPAFYYGTSPNKFFDYIAAGLPVLNNYPGWLADMIGAHECGIAVPPRDPQAFADALQRFADNPVERRRMGANARKLAESRFGRRTLAGQFADVLESVTDK
jgi:glycosyltransferase involved in cell wall biosynthesis